MNSVMNNLVNNIKIPHLSKSVTLNVDVETGQVAACRPFYSQNNKTQIHTTSELNSTSPSFKEDTDTVVIWELGPALDTTYS